MAFRQKDMITVFEVEGRQIKLCRVAYEENRPAIARLTAVNAKDASHAAISGALKRLAADLKITGFPVIVNIQRYNTTVKNIRLPSTNPSEIDRMVTLQAAKQLPFPPEKIISSYRILGSDEQGYSRVMMALVHRDIVERLLSLFSGSGMDVETLCLGSEALSLWCRDKMVRAQGQARVCLIDIGLAHVEIQMLSENRIDFSRAVNFQPGEGTPARMTEEVKKSLLTYEKASGGRGVKRVIVTGKRAAVGNEAPALKKGLNIPVVFVDPVKQRPRKKDAVMPGQALLSQFSFSTLIAVSFYSRDLQVNFIPAEIRSSKVAQMVKESFLVTVALCVSILLGIGGITLKNYLDKKGRLSRVASRLNKTEPKVKKLARLKMATDIIKKQLDLRGSSIDILRELYSRIPPQITLSIFDYEDRDSCLLRGTADRLSDVFAFNSDLEESEYFENVKVRYATKRVIGAREMTDFEIVCQLTPLENR